jgi:hypothetical protein
VPLAHPEAAKTGREATRPFPFQPTVAPVKTSNLGIRFQNLARARIEWADETPRAKSPSFLPTRPANYRPIGDAGEHAHGSPRPPRGDPSAMPAKMAPVTPPATWRAVRDAGEDGCARVCMVVRGSAWLCAGLPTPMVVRGSPDPAPPEFVMHACNRHPA